MVKPRRSIGPTVKYRTCDTCKSTLYFTDLENHFSDDRCPPSADKWCQAYVNDRRLHSYAKPYAKGACNARDCYWPSLLYSIVIDFVFTDDDEVCNDNVVVSVAAIQLCGFVLGEPVIVRCGTKTYVKRIWPSDDLTLSTVYFSKQGTLNAVAILQTLLLPSDVVFIFFYYSVHK